MKNRFDNLNIKYLLIAIQILFIQSFATQVVTIITRKHYSPDGEYYFEIVPPHGKKEGPILPEDFFAIGTLYKIEAGYHYPKKVWSTQLTTKAPYGSACVSNHGRYVVWYYYWHIKSRYDTVVVIYGPQLT